MDHPRPYLVRMKRALVTVALVLALSLLAVGCGGDDVSADTEPVSANTHWIDLEDDVAVTVRTFTDDKGREITCVFSYDVYHGGSSGIDCPEWLNRR